MSTLVDRVCAGIVALSWLCAAECAAGVVSSNERAGDLAYRELRFAAALGLLDGPLPAHEPLSRAELRRLTAALPRGGANPRVARLGEYAQAAASRPYPVVVAPHHRVETSLSSLRRSFAAPENLDYGSRRMEGALYEHDALASVELDHVALEWEGRLRLDRDDLAFRPLVVTARTQWRNLRVTLGREPLSWGPGVHGTLLLTTNARPFDQIRFESERPFPFPLAPEWSDMHVSVFVARLDDPDRSDAPNPWMFGNRFALIPARWLVIGTTRTVMLGGDGFGFDWSVRNVANLILAENENRFGGTMKNNSDQKLTFDVSLYLWPIAPRVPGLDGGRVYVEHGGDDGPRGFPPLPSATATCFGIELVSRGVLVRYERANNDDDGNLWYAHFLYVDGHTLRGRVMGHPMGGDTRAHAADVEIPCRSWGLATLGWEWEKHGYFAAPGLFPGAVEGPVPTAVRQRFRVGLEMWRGGFPGALRVEGRFATERGDTAVYGPIERAGLSVEWRAPFR